jgi:hypothetical protein
MSKMSLAKINTNEIIMAEIILKNNYGKPTMFKLLTMSKMSLAKINTNEIIMAEII